MHKEPVVLGTGQEIVLPLSKVTGKLNVGFIYVAFPRFWSGLEHADLLL